MFSSACSTSNMNLVKSTSFFRGESVFPLQVPALYFMSRKGKEDVKIAMGTTHRGVECVYSPNELPA